MTLEPASARQAPRELVSQPLYGSRRRGPPPCHDRSFRIAAFSLGRSSARVSRPAIMLAAVPPPPNPAGSPGCLAAGSYTFRSTERLEAPSPMEDPMLQTPACLSRNEHWDSCAAFL